MRLTLYALFVLTVLYTHHAFGQSWTTTGIVKETSPGHWLVLQPDGSWHLVIINPQSGFYIDNTISTGSQQGQFEWPSNCGVDPQTGGFYCQ